MSAQVERGRSRPAAPNEEVVLLGFVLGRVVAAPASGEPHGLAVDDPGDATAAGGEVERPVGGGLQPGTHWVVGHVVHIRR